MSQGFAPPIARGKLDWDVDLEQRNVNTRQGVEGVSAVANANASEISTARGTAQTLTARLDIAINPDGTLKEGAPVSGDWTDETDSFARTDDSTITVSGDKTAIYETGRALRLRVSGAYVFSHVVSSAHSSGETTVDLSTSVVTSAPDRLSYGQIVQSTPAIFYGTGSVGLVLADVAYAFDARTGIVGETVTRASQQSYRTPAGTIAYAGANEVAADYVDGEYGVNIYGTRTNLLLQSGDVSLSPWSKNGVTLLTTNVAVPDGQTTAIRVVTNAGLSNPAGNRVFQSVAKAGSEITYTFSVFANSDGENAYSGVFMRVEGSSSGAVNAFVNLVDLEVAPVLSTAGGFSSASVSLEEFANNWIRCSLTFTSDNTTVIRPSIYNWDSENNLADGVRGVLLGGTQLETGAQATPYNPTGAAAVTAQGTSISQDVSDLFNPEGGTFLCKFTTPIASNLNRVFGSNRTGTLTFFDLYVNNTGTSVTFHYNSTSAAGSQQLSAATLPNQSTRVAVSYSLNRISMSVDGADAVSINLATPLSDLNLVSTLFTGKSAVGNELNGLVNFVHYIPSVSTDAELKSLSAS